MGEKKTKQRSDIANQYKWNLEKMYQDEKIWESDFLQVKEAAEKFTAYSGHLGDSGETLYEAMEEKNRIWSILENIFVYARMKKDQDNRLDQYQAMCEKAQVLASIVSEKMSFCTPELLEIPEETLYRFVSKTKGMEIYKHVIDELIREKKHVLSKPEESLMAKFSEVSGAPNAIFKMINDADIKFGNLQDDEGDEVELTHGRYISFLESRDRSVREAAFKAMYAAYIKQKNTLATTYNYNVKTRAMFAKIRKYNSALESALSGDNVETVVYENLIDTVNQGLSLLHRYVDIRGKMLGVDQVHMYDMYAHLIDMPKEAITYEDAVDTVKKALAPLGKEYGEILAKGFEDGWIDVYENEGKTSGAYSFGTYTSDPYVLLNFNGKTKDVFTIAHEMGHSMNSYYTRKTQPYIYGGHSIFTAEVASTVNELLLVHYMMNHAKDDHEKAYILNLYIEEFRGTFFRQTMFAEFEKLTHQASEAGEVLTPEFLCSRYDALNKKYFGDKVAYDSEIAMEWARIPHFYNAFYVYKYATGYSAAVHISEKIIREGEPAVKAYIEFLKAGDSDYPIELLKIAGVDMSKPEPIINAMKVFEGLIEQLEEMRNHTK